MARSGYIPREVWWEIEEIVNPFDPLADLPSQPLTTEEKEKLFLDELAWKDLKRDGLRPCMSCGDLFEVAAEGAIFDRGDLGDLTVHICPKCSHEAMTLLHRISHEQIEDELSSSLEDSPDPAHDYQAWQHPYSEDENTVNHTYTY